MGWNSHHRVVARVVLSVGLSTLLMGACGDGVSTTACFEAPSMEFGASIEEPDHVEVPVRFQSGCTWLAGTLYLPPGNGPHPAMAFLHGSGEAARLGYGGPWITTPLVEAGIAVLTYDKRGVGESQGSCCADDDGAYDVLAADGDAAVRVLRHHGDIDHDRIGVFGLSAAGWVMPIMAERNPDVSFTVTFSGSAVSVGEEIRFSQLTGEDESTPPNTPLDEAVRQVRAEEASGFDPRPFLELARAPGLWIYGAQDQSQPTALDIEILEEIAERHGREFTVELYHDLGHDTTHDPRPIARMIEWIHATIE